jgi:glycosyltransferase involved in cell wall biosynthesis
MKNNLKFSPLISIIMPAHNASKFLCEAIDSVLGQTYKNIELIICNDASTDDTQQIIDKYQLDSRVKYISNVENEGISSSINKCIGLSNGKFIARMDADDIMAPNRLSLQVKYLLEHDDIYMLGGAIELINKNGDILKKRKYPLDHEKIVKTFFYYSPFCNPCLIFRKEVFQEVGLYNSNLDGAEDLDLIARIIVKFKTANLNEILLKFRIHGSSISEVKSRRQEGLTLYIRQKASWEYGLKVNTKAFIYNVIQLISMLIIPNSIMRKIFNFFR